jgi:sulfur carrier protein
MGPVEPPCSATTAADAVRVTVVFSPGPRQVEQQALQLPAGSTLADARAAVEPLLPDGAHAWLAGIWGRQQPPQTLLRDGDRVELYRPLRVDPKVARRERAGPKRARKAASRKAGSAAV